MPFTRRLFILVACLAASAPLIATSVFAHRSAPQLTATKPGGPGITIYAEPNFRGVNASFRTDVADLRKFNLNDRVGSLQIGRGESWEVCENIKYKGRCRTFSSDEADLGRAGWGGMVSSLRRVGGTNTSGNGAGRSRLVLFDDIEYRGRTFTVSQSNSALRALNNRARSAKVEGGSWELCDADRFKGRCKILNGDEPDLGRIGLRDKVSSARPVGR